MFTFSYQEVSKARPLKSFTANEIKGKKAEAGVEGGEQRAKGKRVKAEDGETGAPKLVFLKCKGPTTVEGEPLPHRKYSSDICYITFFHMIASRG